jgi:GrpB-like predicted nucleotidyltransferase (UPF0157 family)
MLTSDQQKWIEHLSDTKIVSVVPFDPTCEEKYLKVKEAIQKVFGGKQAVVHSGASALGISGQDEIDIYVPVPALEFNISVEKMKTIYGEPGSHYPFKRARFVANFDNKHIDVFVINEEDANWKDSVRFQSYLLAHPDALDRYRRLKEDAAGQTVREYYRRKTEFINEILALA